MALEGVELQTLVSEPDALTTQPPLVFKQLLRLYNIFLQPQTSTLLKFLNLKIC